MNALTATHKLRWLIENWWFTLLRGVAAIAFGVLTFAAPGITVLTLTTLWGAFALVDGVIAIATAAKTTGGDSSSRWWMVLIGVVGVLAGVLTFINPLATSLGLLFFLAAWLIIAGVLQIIGAIRLRAVIENEWTLGLIGLLSALLGVSLIVAPGSGLLSVAWLIGSFAIVAGIGYVMLAFRLKKLREHG